MAFIGLAKPYVAALKDDSGVRPVYEKGFRCGKLMTVNVTPNYNESSLYADNQLSEYVKEFKDGTITLGTDRLPAEASEVMFGHKVSNDGREVTYKTGDAGGYVGIGFVIESVEDGNKKYEANVIYKCKFAEGAKSYATKGASIEFQTPSIEGAIAGLAGNTEWKTTKLFDTEAEAVAFIEETLGFTTLGTLTVTSAAGTNTGDTAITVSESLGTGNSYRYKVDSSATQVTFGMDVSSWDSWDGSDDITAASGDVITLVECDSDNKAVRAGSATVVSA